MTGRQVLFICVENAGRSLMAEAIFNADPPPGWVATSAGTRPAAAPNPRTGPLLEEIDLRLPEHAPQMLTQEMMEEAGIRVTLGCLDDASCPARLKSLTVRDWGLEDPAHLDDDGFRRIRGKLVDLILGLRTEIVASDRRPTDQVPNPPP